MPVVYECSSCGTLLHWAGLDRENKRLKGWWTQGPVTSLPHLQPPRLVADRYDGRCPKCGRELNQSHALESIEVR